MKTKQIVFTKAYTAELLTVDCLPPAEDEVTVEMAFSAISAGTERANFVGMRASVSESEEAEPTFPRTVGYSCSGRVVAVGDRVKSVAIGDRVVVLWGKHCGHITVKEAAVIRIPDEVSDEEAALVYISVFPLAAIRKTRLEIGESALVMGLGILGAFAVAELRAAGAYPIVAADPVAERREMALSLGADYALDPTAEDFGARVKELTSGGARVCIEVTGLGQGLQQALDCMRPLGRVALLGCTRSSHFEIDYYGKVHGPGISLIGAHTIARPATDSSAGLWTKEDDVRAVLSLLRGGRLSLGKVIREIHSPEEAQTVFDRLASERNFPLGVLFDWKRIR